MALVTGASSGIGRSVALELASRGHDLVASGRNVEALRTLAGCANRIGASVHIVASDLTEPEGVDRLTAAAGRGGVDVLANCAGTGSFGPLHRTGWPVTERLLVLNVLSASQLAAQLVPGMVTRGRGHVLTVASTSAFFANGDTAAYNASKAYLVSLSLSLNEGLRGTGVSATVSCPGPTRTRFAERAGIPGGRRPNRRRTVTPEAVASDAVEAMFARRPLLVHGRVNRAAVLLTRALPASGVLRARHRVAELTGWRAR